MPPKKPPLPAAINIRLKRDEAAAITADVQAIRKGSDIPLTVSGYAKHALLSYARLRRMEIELRSLHAGFDDGIEVGDPKPSDSGAVQHAKIFRNRLDLILRSS